MNGIIDNVLVGLALLASALYVLTSLGPRSLRYRLLAAMSRQVARLPEFLRLRRAAQRLAAAAGRAAGAGGGCNGCSSSPASAKAPRKSLSGLPVGKHGRRA
ncbi:MAG TPA: DUF6587 family protein [Steroidobacteraceae bacterium]|nr:DUF6587 family protein [Steroidobacteraceae bacterium]